MNKKVIVARGKLEEKGLKFHERPWHKGTCFTFMRDAFFTHSSRLSLLFQAKIASSTNALEFAVNIHQE